MLTSKGTIGSVSVLLETLLIVSNQIRLKDQYIILVGVSSSHCDLFKLGPLRTGMRQLKVTALVLWLVYHLLAMGTQFWSITTCTRERTMGLPIPTPDPHLLCHIKQA